MNTAPTRPLNRITLLLNRLAGAVFALMALISLAWSILFLYQVDWTRSGFQALFALIFSALAWLYLKGPFSRLEIGTLPQIAGLGLAAPILLAFLFIAWEQWREHRLRSYCESVHVGMSVKDMLSLQKRYGIEESLLNPYSRDVLHQKVTDRDVEFIGGYPGDPDFECSFRHNGEVVLSAEIAP